MICNFCGAKTEMTIKYAEVPFVPVDKTPYPCCRPCYDRINDTPFIKTGKKKGRKTYHIYVSCIFKEKVVEATEE
jgi:hypothetical protein